MEKVYQMTGLDKESKFGLFQKEDKSDGN